jgi:hypothetical protein
VRGRVVRAEGGGGGAGGIGLDHTRDCKRNRPWSVAGHAGFCNALYDGHRASPARAGPRE